MKASDNNTSEGAYSLYEKGIHFLITCYAALLPFENITKVWFENDTAFRPHRILAILIGCCIFFGKPFSKFRLGKVDLYILGMFLLGLIPSFIAFLSGRFESHHFFLTSIQLLIIFWVFIMIRNSRMDSKLLSSWIAVYSFGVLINGLYMIYQFLNFDIGRQSGLMDNPNYAALAINIAFAFYMNKYLSSQQSFYSFSRLWDLLFSVLLLVAMFISGSRLALLTLALVLLVILFYHFSYSKLKKLGYVFVAMVTILIISETATPLLKVLPAIDRLEKLSDKDEGRFTLWKQGWIAFSDSGFIGLGIEQFKNEANYRKYVQSTQNLSVAQHHGLVLHNDYLTVLFEYGIIPFLLFIAFYFRIFNQLRRIKVDYAEFYMAAFLSIVLFSIFDSNFQSHFIWFILALLSIIPCAALNSKPFKPVDCPAVSPSHTGQTN